MDINEIKDSVAPGLRRVNDLIRSTLESEVFLLNTINEYLHDIKGKQLRPLLSLLSGMACGIPDEKTYRCAAVAEMIHTATLLHDDVADDAPQRRGSQTVQSRFSPASSVLTGDYWLAKALSLLVSQNDNKLMGFYTKAVQDLSEGELLQMQKATSLDTTKEDYLSIISKKTSSLFIAAIAGAAYSAGAPEKVINCMERYAYHLGVAFQIRDDIFDYMPDLDTGKNAGTDIREKKLTLPLICALNTAGKERGNSILSFIKESREGDPTLVQRTFAFVDEYDGVGCAQSVLCEHSDKAIEALSILEDSVYKFELERVARYVGERII